MFHDRRRFVNTRIWNTEAKPASFPERDDPDGLAVPWLSEKADLGVTFSGGGTRSAAATLGQLRGLQATGLLKHVRYISAVSGGSWSAVPFTYLPQPFDENLFLGDAKDPEALTLGDFRRAKQGSLARAISNTGVTDDFLWEMFKLGGDETYARAIGRLFLKPFALDDTDRFFTFHAAARDAVLAGNQKTDDGQYYLEEGDFHTVREGRPYLVVGSTILRVDNTGYSPQKIQCEYTPLYTGVRRLFPKAGRRGAPIGGGYVESFAYDSKNPREQWDGRRWRVKLGRKRYRLTLSDVIGSSGAAPAEWLENKRFNHLGFPEFRHWPIHQVGEIDEEEYGHGDGGHLENLGVMPLLARGVKNMLVFVNTKTKFQPEDEKGPYAESLEPLFRPVADRDAIGGNAKFRTNVVFKEDDKFDALITGLQKRKAQEQTLIHCDTYTVCQNSHYQIKGNYKVNVCWVYNEAVKTWSNALSTEVRRLVADLPRFPHYCTFFQNPPKVIDLSVKEVNALAHLSCWNVTTHAQTIRNHFGFKEPES